MTDQKPIYTPENPKLYDETEFYNAELEPLVEKIQKLCLEKDIPHLILIQTADSEKEADFAGAAHTGVETHSPRISLAYAAYNR